MVASVRQPARWVVAIVVAVAVFVFTRVRGEVPAYVAIHRWLADLGVDGSTRNLDASLLIVLGSLLAARIAGGRGQTCKTLGLHGSLPAGLAFALLAGLPMLLQAAVSSTGVRFDANTMRVVLLAPFVEEIFFRAVLVSIPVRQTGRCFWPITILAGALFGSLHVPWTSGLGFDHLGILGATMAGGIWYAWLLRCYEWNLWTTIGLHAVMNGAWVVFGVAGDAAGGLWPNIGRGLTIALGTVLAIRHRRRAGQKTAAQV